ncbi:hypothetical protein P4V72_20335 [Bacillus thuringiensis]|uniref:hypothetical protein n=1 Tax=Bacillus thuringiensis TaxID=1428 RepID=UPI0019398B81|nr:hypothetical protein [Bacillus thuringiensis]MEC3572068.1 hypothetical protein [Bacillus thuringiensis]MED2022012.1 hypothetical protein [Bacillus thuringiensis]MED2143516.1 hypothetical protein [Bacillus thuringiensis]MED2517808.1 hypothetical protein [Bacillus thuringiensis]
MQQYVTYATRLVKAKDVKAICCESKNYFKNGSKEKAVNSMLKLTERSEHVGQH